MTLRWLMALAAVSGCAQHPKPTTTPVTGVALAVVADPKLIDMTAESTTTLVTAAAASEIGIRVKITARALPPANRPPLDLALVLDTSGSMEGDAIDALRASAQEVVRKMRDGDRIAVIAFHSKVDVLVPTTPLDDVSRARIDRAIAQINANGTTDLVGGLAAGAQQVQAAGLPDAIHRIVLLSDGVPNQAIQLPALLTSLHQQAISVTTLGFGIDYDTSVMTQIANDTGGNFHYVEQPTEIAAVFDDELIKMKTVVARNLQLVIEPGPGVSFRPMPGLQFVGDGRITAQIGDLSAGETRDLMIPIDVSARGNGATVEVVDATLTFVDVIGKSGAGERDAFVSVKASDDKDKVSGAVKVALEIARVRTTAASAMLEAIGLARAGHVPEAHKRIDAAVVEVKAAMKKYKDSDLASVLDELDSVQKDIAQLVVAAPPPVVQPTQVVGVSGEMPSPKPSAPPPMADQPAVAPSPVERDLRRKQDRAVKTVRGQ